MMRLTPLLLVILMAGCTESPLPVDEHAGSSPTSACISTSSTVGTMAGGYNYRVQTGGGGGGRFFDLEFAHNPEHLAILNITMEWTAQSPLTRDLRIDAWLYETLTIEQQPDIQGPSPLIWSLPIRDLEMMEGPGLALGPPQNPGLPASVSATVVDQPVTLTIEQVYCPDTLHP